MPQSPRNVKRALFIGGIIKAAYKNDSRGVVKEDVIDVLADLLHLCQREEISFSDALWIANTHFHEERR